MNIGQTIPYNTDRGQETRFVAGVWLMSTKVECLWC
jgi:hypothetical protein